MIQVEWSIDVEGPQFKSRLELCWKTPHSTGLTLFRFGEWQGVKRTGNGQLGTTLHFYHPLPMPTPTVNNPAIDGNKP